MSVQALLWEELPARLLGTRYLVKLHCGFSIPMTLIQDINVGPGREVSLYKDISSIAVVNESHVIRFNAIRQPRHLLCRTSRKLE